MDFKVGDKVRAWGVDGVVVDVRYFEPYHISVEFQGERIKDFLPDGREFSWHKEPSLTLIERAEEFEEVVMYHPVLVFNEGPRFDIFQLGIGIFPTAKLALSCNPTNDNATVIGYREVKVMRKK